MNLFRSKTEICLALAIAALISIAITFWPLARSTAFYFKVTMRSSLPGFAQLFYDVGSGLNESDSHRLPIEGGNRNVRYQLNGKVTDYFRVNSTFKGLSFPKAGDYVVSYAYWPRYFTLSLLVAGAGVTALLCWLAIMTSDGIRRVTVS